MQEYLREKRSGLENQRHRLVTRSPLSMIPYHRQRVDDFVLRAGRALQYRIAGIRSQVSVHRRDLLSRFGLVLLDKRAEVRSLSDRLTALDPKATLNRGYALCETARDSRPVRSVRDVPEKEDVRVHLFDGSFEATPVLSHPEWPQSDTPV
jgi:exonuclease VII large subunit